MAQLERATAGRQVGGVAAGLSRYSGIDVNLIRIALAIGSLASAGTIIPALYVLAWVLLPEAGTGHRIIEDLQQQRRGLPGPGPQQRDTTTTAGTKNAAGSVWEQPYQAPLHNPDDLR